MTAQEAGPNNPSNPKDSVPETAEPELDAYGLAIQKRATTLRYCLSIGSLSCGIVEVGLVIAEIVTHRKLALYLLVLGWLLGFTAAFLGIPGSLSGSDGRTERIAKYGPILGVIGVFAWVIATGNGAALNNTP